LIEPPRRQTHGSLILAGGLIFDIVSIALFLPFVASDYIVLFLITALAITAILPGMSDFGGILAYSILKHEVKDGWSKFFRSVAKDHNRMARYGLAKMVIVDRDKYDGILKESIQHEHSIAYLDNLDFRGWTVLFSLLALGSALMVSFVNWPVFWSLRWFGVEVVADFSILFWALAGIAFILTITERLILRHRKRENSRSGGPRS